MKHKISLFLILFFNKVYAQTINNSKIPLKLTISQTPAYNLIDQELYKNMKFREVFMQWGEGKRIIDENSYNNEINYVKSNENLCLAFYKGQIGYINKMRKVVIPFQYRFEHESTNLIFQDKMILKKGNVFGLIDEYNQIIIPFDNQRLEKIQFTDVYSAKKNDKIGIYDSYGNVKIPFVYDSLLNVFNVNGIINIVLLKDNKVGMVSSTNKTLIPFEYKNIKQMVGKPIYEVLNQNKSQILGEDFKPIFKKEYSNFYELSPHHLLASYQNRTGVIDFQENIIIPFENNYSFDEVLNSNISNLENHYYIVKKDGKVGLYDFKAKKESIAPIFDRISHLDYDYYWVTKNNLGQIYKNGVVVFPFIFKKYEHKNSFMAFTDDNDKIINLKWQNQELVEIKDNFKRITAHIGDYIIENNKWGYKNTNEIFIKPMYDSISRWDKNEITLFLVKKNNKYGVINRNNIEIIPIEYDEVKKMEFYYSYQTTLAIRRNNKWAIYDCSEGYISDFKYKKVRYLPSYNLYYLDDILCSRIGINFIPYKKN
jgi:WG containing repeat